MSLEETIRKIIQSEFVNYLPHIIQQAKKCEPVSAQDSDEEDILDGPMKIDFIQKKEPSTSIATVKCKIKRLKIPAMLLDSCAELLIITPDIVECVGYGIDKSIKHDLSSIATLPIKSVGVVHDLPITFTGRMTKNQQKFMVQKSLPIFAYSWLFLAIFGLFANSFIYSYLFINIHKSAVLFALFFLLFLAYFYLFFSVQPVTAIQMKIQIKKI